jgi:hypothetical protein
MSVTLLAAELTHMDVQRKGKRFYLDSTLIVDAPIETMYTILTDYNSMHQFSRGIVHTQDVTPDDQGRRRVYSHIRGCVAFICRNLERVERLESVQYSKITTTLDPQLSKNVRWNISTWELESVQADTQLVNKLQASKTRIRYQMEFEPGFWVPPLIGGYMVKRSLAQDGIEIMSRMEAHAQGVFPVDPAKNKKLSFPKLELEQKDFVTLKKSPKDTS